MIPTRPTVHRTTVATPLWAKSPGSLQGKHQGASSLGFNLNLLNDHHQQYDLEHIPSPFP